MSLPALDNLVHIGQLKVEPRNEAEARRMLAMARTRLEDARHHHRELHSSLSFTDSGGRHRACRGGSTTARDFCYNVCTL